MVDQGQNAAVLGRDASRAPKFGASELGGFGFGPSARMAVRMFVGHARALAEETHATRKRDAAELQTWAAQMMGDGGNGTADVPLPSAVEPVSPHLTVRQSTGVGHHSQPRSFALAAKRYGFICLVVAK